MDSLPVTLIVKAPNQQIEDQKIRCETSWTINKLKQHLSEVYPSKPPQHEQKLIYSGQLLKDSVILKDILRQYEGQDTHTVHLVCAPDSFKMTNNLNNTMSRKQQHHSANNTDEERIGNNNISSSSSGPPSSTAAEVNNSSTEATTNFTNQRIPSSFWNQHPTQQIPVINVQTMNQYQIQMAWMQAYMQYMSQYMQMTDQQFASTTSRVENGAAAEHAENVQINQQQQPDHQQNVNNIPGVAAAQQQPQENEDRDWLDVFYMLSRAMVLFSVVYFYSSPVRFIFVLLLGLVLYLYQAGFFRSINLNNNHINVAPNNNDDGVLQQEENEELLTNPTRFMIAWTFITTFFTSLVPEIPNINA